MRIGPAYDEWQVWFAWYPVRIRGQRVWLEKVRRRRLGSNTYGWGYIYDDVGGPEF